MGKCTPIYEEMNPMPVLSKLTQLVSHRAGTRTQLLVVLNLSLLKVLVVGFGGLHILDFTSGQHATAVTLT